MKTHQMTDNQATSADTTLEEEAAGWLISLRDPDPSLDDPYHDPSVRNRAFFVWLKRSPANLRAFMEIVELKRRIQGLDAATFRDIAGQIQGSSATVAPLSIQVNRAAEPSAASDEHASPYRRRIAVASALAAGLVLIAVGVYLFSNLVSSRTQIYATQVGEQQSYPLQDGSVIQLNTDSRVEVKYTADVRDIHLVRGEAYFDVKHDDRRPFIVTADGATARAVGTEFDVRQRSQSTNVVVFKGTVQVGAVSGGGDNSARARSNSDQSGRSVEALPATAVLLAGDIAEVSAEGVTKVVGGNVDEALSWRQKRLIFHNARLADVAAEFNRYNHTQIRVEGKEANELTLSGIFAPAQYEYVILYAKKQDRLVAIRDGDEWVIRSRD